MHPLLFRLSFHLARLVVLADTTVPIIKSVGNTITTIIFDNAKLILAPTLVIGVLLWWFGSTYDERVGQMGKRICITSILGMIILYGVIGVVAVNVVNAVAGASPPTQ